MSSFAEIVGHENIIEHFRRAIREGKVSHSYILSGEAHAGKMMLAESFAKALQCTDPSSRTTGEACGRCISCLQAESHNHPDIIYVTHEKTVISVEDVRQQIVATADILPYSGDYKVYIVDEAERMNEQAQNALLKTIEEPPAYVVILLLTTNTNQLLATIRSRCVEMPVHPVSEAKIRRFLMQKYELPDYSAQVAAAFSQGNVGKAVQFASSGTFTEQKEKMTEIMKRMPRMHFSELMGYVKDLSGAKKEIDTYLDFVTIWLRDVLLAKACGEQAKLICREEERDIKNQAAHVTYEGLERSFRAVQGAKARFRANVNFEVALETMLVQLRDEFLE
ncbi:MAG: DNA polymerase III subunit delta' [Lachnospiraceae bacterium]|nr:DNA polymerase III subunit delta' [Lachnospiraceae bacterium]